VLDFDHHANHYVKDFVSTKRCNSRFCPDCSKRMANTKEYKLSPALYEIKKYCDIFNITLTATNCQGSNMPPGLYDPKCFELRPHLDHMAKCFKTLDSYLRGKVKIKGLDFSFLGYVGGLRSLEIVWHPERLYHPHYHGFLILKKGLILLGRHKNKFSKKKGNNIIYYFSDFEVLIQKIWYLLINRQKVTLESINKVTLGYSCKVEYADSWHQSFKYITKPSKQGLMPKDVFVDLTDALHLKKSIQCYGILSKLKLRLEKDDIDEQADTAYDDIKYYLNNYDPPTKTHETPFEVRGNILRGQSIYITRRRINKLLREGNTIEDIISMLQARYGIAVQEVMDGLPADYAIKLKAKQDVSAYKRIREVSGWNKSDTPSDETIAYRHRMIAAAEASHIAKLESEYSIPSTSATDNTAFIGSISKTLSKRQPKNKTIKMPQPKESPTVSIDLRVQIRTLLGVEQCSPKDIP